CFIFSSPALPSTYTLSLHDALPISSVTLLAPSWPLPTSSSPRSLCRESGCLWGYFPEQRHRNEGTRERGIPPQTAAFAAQAARRDRKSTRLNSSHVASSYAVFCLKK